MEKNNQLLILGAIALGTVLIIALALIFTRSSDDTATEIASENNTSETQESGDTGENGEDDQQPALSISSDDYIFLVRQQDSCSLTHIADIPVSQCNDEWHIDMAVKDEPTDTELDNLWQTLLSDARYTTDSKQLYLFIYTHNGSDDWGSYDVVNDLRKVFEHLAPPTSDDYIVLDRKCSDLRRPDDLCTTWTLKVAVEDKPIDEVIKKAMSNLASDFSTEYPDTRQVNIFVYGYNGGNSIYAYNGDDLLDELTYRFDE